MPLKWSFNGEAVFSGLDADGDIGLWVTNGTAAGTHELTGINGANPGGLFQVTSPLSRSSTVKWIHARSPGAVAPFQLRNLSGYPPLIRRPETMGASRRRCGG